jgi:arabinan endo-1,5-alpha-L-arabinosidase
MKRLPFSIRSVVLVIAIIAICLGLSSNAPTPALALSGSIGIHDPSSISANNCYYSFGTGTWLPILKSCGGMYGSWSFLKNVFSSLPSWIPGAIGATPGNLWAPDINFFNGRYYLYYAASSFGTNRSAIGVATASNIEGPWMDQGEVLRSTTSNNYNAIDPDYHDGWLSFGSFWDGIKMRKINTSTGKLDTTNTTLYSIASRGGGAIEAPSIMFSGGYYYLFVSFDMCCSGVNSTYRMMVGRSSSITGPYLDRNGVDMRNGGGTQLLATNGAEVGPGGQDVFSNYLSYHFYDGNANGASKLNIRPITFSGGWPTLGAPITSNGTALPTNTPLPGGSFPVAGTYYRLINRNSGKVADVANCSTADGADIRQWTSVGNTCQQWSFVGVGSGYYRVVNRNSGKVMDVNGASTADGGNVLQWSNNGGTNQHWSLISLGSSYYRIVNRNSGKDLDVAGCGTADGSDIRQWTWLNNNCQQWQIIP